MKMNLQAENIFIWFRTKTRFDTEAKGNLGPVHNRQEKFENGVSALKTYHMFSVHTTPEKFENAAITGHFGSVLEVISGREIT